MIRLLGISLVLVTILVHLSDARYLTPTNPKAYATGESLTVKMNKISSNLLSYPFYSENSPYSPDLNDKKSEGSFTFRLSGNGQFTQLFEMRSMNNHCYTAETKTQILSKDDVNQFIALIEDQYRAHFYVDGLPVGEELPGNGGTYIHLGYPIGHIVEKEGDKRRYYLNNHVLVNLKFIPEKDHDNSDTGRYYLGKATVIPKSFISCEIRQGLELESDKQANVSWSAETISASVHDAMKLEDRWDIYYPHSVVLESTSAVGGFLVTVFVCGVFALVLYKVFKNDTPIGYLQLGESGWKSIYADVFRSPNRFMTFSIIIGTGMQIAVASFILTVFYVGGLLSIANPGSFKLALILIFAFSGIASGYAAMRTYIMLGGTRKRYCALLNSILIPFILLVIIFISKFQLWSNSILYAPSASEVILVISMWLFVSIPFSLASAYFVYSWPPAEYPFKPNHIPRMIPKSQLYQNHYIHSLVLGFLPFLVIYTQLNFELAPMFSNYHVNNSYDLLIAFVMMVINILVINMLITFYQLSREDYNWWWRSIIGPSCTSIYIFIYLLVYGYPRATGGTGFYYFMLSFSIALFSALFFSSIGFLGNLWFVKKIYATLHFE